MTRVFIKKSRKTNCLVVSSNTYHLFLSAIVMKSSYIYLFYLYLFMFYCICSPFQYVQVYWFSFAFSVYCSYMFSLVFYNDFFIFLSGSRRFYLVSLYLYQPGPSQASYFPKTQDEYLTHLSDILFVLVEPSTIDKQNTRRVNKNQFDNTQRLYKKS